MRLRRPLVRCRDQLDYAGVQAAHGRRASRRESLRCPELGRLRRGPAVAPRRDRAGLPEQEVVPDRRGRLTRSIRAAACRSRTGTRRSRCSRDGGRGSCWTPGVGVCARCPPPEPSAVEQLSARRRRSGSLARRGHRRRRCCRAFPGGRRRGACARCAGRRASCGVRATRRSTRPRRGAAATPAPAASARRTRTSPLRCGGSWNRSARRSASLSRRFRLRECRPPRCRPPVGDGGVRRGGGQGGRAGWAAPRPRCWPPRRSRSSPRSCCRGLQTENEPGEVFVQPSRPCWPRAPACRGRAKWCGWSWSRRIRAAGESRSGRSEASLGSGGGCGWRQHELAILAGEGDLRSPGFAGLLFAELPGGGDALPEDPAGFPTCRSATWS